MHTFVKFLLIIRYNFKAIELNLHKLKSKGINVHTLIDGQKTKIKVQAYHYQAHTLIGWLGIASA